MCSKAGFQARTICKDTVFPKSATQVLMRKLLLNCRQNVFNKAIFEAFMAVMIQVEVFCVVMPCSVVVGYHRFRGPCCLHRQGES
jgi:hypothetical protein